MNATTYNCTIAAGVTATSCGAGLQWGLGPALMVAGALVLALTVFAAVMIAKAR